MVYGVIDSKSREYYTYLGQVFDAIGDEQLRYNWLITDSETAPCGPELLKLNTKQYSEYKDGKYVLIPTPEYVFLSGRELTDIVRRDDSQWIWGVLSAFEKDIPAEEILKYPLPYADGNGDLWQNPVSMQNPLAVMEIVPWDSCLMLLKSKDEKMIQRFKSSFTLCRGLASYNDET